MPWIDELLDYKEKNHPSPTFDKMMEYLDKLSIEEDEKFSRQVYDSLWKDQIREYLKPYEDRLKRDETSEILLQLIFRLMGETRNDAVIHHWLFRRIKALETNIPHPI